MSSRSAWVREPTHPRFRKPIPARGLSWHDLRMPVAPRRTAELAASSAFGYASTAASDGFVQLGLGLAAVAAIGTFGIDLALTWSQGRRRVVAFIDRRLAAAAPIRAAFADAATDYQAVEAAWIEWREETRRGLPRRCRLEFIESDPARRVAFLAGRPIGCSRDAVAAVLDWDLHRLGSLAERLGDSRVGALNAAR